MQIASAIIILLFLCYPCLVFDFLCATQMLFITFTTRIRAILNRHTRRWQQLSLRMVCNFNRQSIFTIGTRHRMSLSFIEWLCGTWKFLWKHIESYAYISRMHTQNDQHMAICHWQTSGYEIIVTFDRYMTALEQKPRIHYLRAKCWSLMQND